MGEKTEVLLATFEFEGCEVAEDFDSLKVYGTGEENINAARDNRIIKVNHCSSEPWSISTLVLPSFGEMDAEVEQRFYSIMSKVTYGALRGIKDGMNLIVTNQFRLNIHLGVKESFINVLNKDFKNKNVQLMLAITILKSSFAYPDWFVDLVLKNEDDFEAQFEEALKEYYNPPVFNGISVNHVIKLLNECFNLFNRTDYRNMNKGFLSVKDHTYSSKANFELNNLIQTWLFSGDASMTFGDAIDKGFSLAKADPRMVTPENVELAWVFADKLISVLFEGNPNEDFFTIPDNVDMLELLKSDKVVQEKWSRVFNLTVFEALSIHSNVLADEEVLKIFGRARKVTLNSTLLLWRDGLADNSKAYGKKSVKTVLDKYTDEMFMNFGEEHFGLTLDQVDLLIEWDAYCSANDYIPWHFYKMLNTEAKTMEVTKTMTF